MSEKSIALRVAVRKHLLDNDASYRIAESLFIYPHHYPLSILSWRNENPHIRTNTLLTKMEASKIVNNDFGNTRLPFPLFSGMLSTKYTK